MLLISRPSVDYVVGAANEVRFEWIDVAEVHKREQDAKLAISRTF